MSATEARARGIADLVAVEYKNSTNFTQKFEI